MRGLSAAGRTGDICVDVEERGDGAEENFLCAGLVERGFALGGALIGFLRVFCGLGSGRGLLLLWGGARVSLNISGGGVSAERGGGSIGWVWLSSEDSS